MSKDPVRMHLIIIIVLKDVKYNFSFRSMLPQLYTLFVSIRFYFRFEKLWKQPYIWSRINLDQFLEISPR